MFYSLLNEENLTQKRSKHANKVWTAFACNILVNHYDLYLKTDVCLLADVLKTSETFA